MLQDCSIGLIRPAECIIENIVEREKQSDQHPHYPILGKNQTDDKDYKAPHPQAHAVNSALANKTAMQPPTLPPSTGTQKFRQTLSSPDAVTWEAA